MLDSRAVKILALTLMNSGCPTLLLSDYEPCGANGVVEGGVNYVDGHYNDPQGTPYAFAGDRPFGDCTVIDGIIYIAGKIDHFEDFEKMEEIGGFFVGEVELPTAEAVAGASDFSGCGLVQGFPNLKRITRKQYDSLGYVGGACLYYDGFESLKFVQGNFGCIGNDSLGSSLVEVTGHLSCPFADLENLERVGRFELNGRPLPSLVWAGRLTMGSLTTENPRFDLPLLEYIGSSDVASDGNLIISGSGALSLDLSSLQGVELRMEIGGFGAIPLDVPEAERGDEVRRRLENVTVGGRRGICRNGPDDPCPWDSDCEEVHGVDSILCCTLLWPECLALEAEKDG